MVAQTEFGEDRKEGNILKSFKITGTLVNDLEDISKKLEKRLEPIVRKELDVEEISSEKKDVGSLASFAFQIGTLNERLQNILSILNHLIDKIDL